MRGTLVLKNVFQSSRCIQRTPATILKALRSSSDIDKISAFYGAMKSPVTNIKGVGPKLQDCLNNLGLFCIGDVLLHFPIDVLDRSRQILLSTAIMGNLVTVKLKVETCKKGFKNMPHTFKCYDSERTRVEVKYFCGNAPGMGNVRWNQLTKMVFKENSFVIVSGKLGFSDYSGDLEIVNPDVEMSAMEPPDEIARKFSVEPVYRLTQGLTSYKMRMIIQACLQEVSGASSDSPQNQLPDWLPADIRTTWDWPNLLQSLHAIHNPISSECIKPGSPPRCRIAFDELTALFLHRSKKEQLLNEYLAGTESAASMSYSVAGNGMYTERLLQQLPFKLTSCQQAAVDIIYTEMKSDKRMKRLVQGDVGSGKTIVAILALLRAVEDSAHQGAFLAPTEILAKQHFETISKIFNDISVSNPEGAGRPRTLRVELITGAVKGKSRDQLLAQLSNGSIDILVGTHALLTDAVLQSFKKLGLVVIDEEQRFGVQQRDSLADRSNVMFMTATPLPRSLMMLHDDDYKVSNLIEKPPLKRSVITLPLGLSKVDKLIARIGVHPHSKVFWVCPTLMPDDSSPGTSVIERFQQLSMLFPGRTALLHGKLSSEEKNAAMDSFAKPDSEINILVSTSVIEVGVDVPESSICVIDNAANFGIAQLHQIRGRIGRGSPPPKETLSDCYCMLLYDDVSKATVDSPVVQLPQKLMILQNTTDGFDIAEADLFLRGPGDFFGFRQSGFSGYKAVSLTEHAYLLPKAQRVAAQEVKCGIHDTHITGLMSLFPEPSPPGSAAPKVASSTAHTTREPSSAPRTISTASRKIVPGVRNLAVDLTATSSPTNPLVVLLDLETTGLRKERDDRIIQIAAKVLGDRSVDVFSAYIRPGNGILLSDKIVKLTRITQKLLDDEGTTFEEAWYSFETWLQKASADPLSSSPRPIVIMAHNGQIFDIPFVGYELSRHGLCSDIDCQQWGALYNITCFVDTLPLFKDKAFWESRRAALGMKSTSSYFPGRHNLPYLYAFVTGKNLEGAHNGVNDVNALEEILESPGLSHTWREHANKFQYVHFVQHKT